MGAKYRQLAGEERGVIQALTGQEAGVRAIARSLGRSPSTISRERRRNGYREPEEPLRGRPPARYRHYDAQQADSRARRLRHKARRPRKLRRDGTLWWWVQTLLGWCWSPQQIAGTLRKVFPDEPAMHVCHETIYTAIYAMPRGELRKALMAPLRQGRTRRRPRSRGKDRRGQIADMVSIHLRPPEVAERLLPGHWEGDLIKGGRASAAVGTLVDRHSLFCMLVKLDDSTAQRALAGFQAAFGPLPEHLRQTLTYDQGKEMALHKVLAETTGLRIYFADPHSPWQRGLNENTNGLLRQYLPKSTDLGQFSQRELDYIAWQLNTRPRASLGFRSPAEVFFEHYDQDRRKPAVAVDP